MRQRRAAVIAITSVVFVLYGCGDECETSADCGTGQVCVNGACKEMDTGGDSDVESDTVSDTETDSDDDTDPALFDPNDVYLWGTLVEGLSGREAIGNFNNPFIALTGFKEWASSTTAVINPNNGRLLYQESVIEDSYIRQFAIDEVVDYNWDYPKSPLDNDPILSTVCPDDIVHDFRMSPDGEMIYRCPDYFWYDSDGTEILVGFISVPYCLGGAKQALIYDGLGWIIKDIYGGGEIEVEFDISEDFVAVRAFVDHFVFAYRIGYETTLWRVDFDGTKTELGAYSPHPNNFVLPYGGVIAGDLSLYEIGLSDGKFSMNMVCRRTLHGESDIVYSEFDDPVVRIHGSNLFTGP